MIEAGARGGSSSRLIRKFSPGTFQSDREVKEQFVVRNRELGIVLEVLRGNIEPLSCQHVLIVAPRGRGKTMLLARIVAELRTDDELSSRLLPVRFMEESQEIFDLADFWLETLFHLARETAAYDPGLARELQDTHATLAARWRESALHEHAHAAVLDAADRLGRKLVLMVENLQSLCENVDDDFGWKLREVLQSEPQVMLLASATSHFKGLDDVEKPFFELFRIVGLEPLDTEECRRLWQVVSGDAVSRREIRPLEILTGGNPRLLVIVAGFARHRSLRRLMEELVTLIDEHTEYFRSHLELLPKSERRVYLAVIDLWQPSSAGEIAARARMDIRVVSTMLGRLVERGAVIVDEASRGRRRLYAAAEPLYSIYYKLRRERDETAVVENLILFMVAFYHISELLEIRNQLYPEARESAVVLAGIDRALVKIPLTEEFPPRMKRDLVKEVSESAASYHQTMAVMRLQQDIEAAFEDETFERVIDLAEQFVASGRLATVSMPEHLVAYLAHVKARAYHQMGEYERVAAVSSKFVERFRDTRNVSLLLRSLALLICKAEAQLELGDFKGAIVTCKETTDRFGELDGPLFRGSVAAASVIQAEAETEVGNYGTAVSLLDDVVERFGDDDTAEVQSSVVRALVEKGIIERARHKHHEAIAAFDEAVRRFGDSQVPDIKDFVASAILNRAFEYGVSGDFEGELASYQEVVDRYGNTDTPTARSDVAIALSFKGMRQAELGRAENALQTCEELDTRIGVVSGDEKKVEAWRIWLGWRTGCVRALALTAQGERAAAMEAFRSAYGAFLNNHEIAMREILRLVPGLVAAGASAQEIIEILSTDGTKSRALAPLITALRQYGGETVRAPAEVREVAADIRKRIEERVTNTRTSPEAISKGFI